MMKMVKHRQTIQKIKILEHLKSVKTHPTAENVYNAVRKDFPTITLATVYRNLNLLAEQGEILRFEVNKEYRFDGEVCSHQHCVCRKCGNILDIFDKKMSEMSMNSLSTKKFEPDSVCIIFHGICNNCSKNRR